MATRKRRAENAGSTESVEVDLTTSSVPVDADEHLLQIPDSQRCLISLTGKALERSLLWKLDWGNYMCVFFFFLFLFFFFPFFDSVSFLLCCASPLTMTSEK